ncbi:cation diffusion facilitator family transporter [Pasteuria penetrans]|uniref:cation diffusion facilitator family transporter n=1 Tax=Pasteuria penetrans TaxID=86005 RepID=UPI000FC22CAC|nr:cation diffusion facilitator family transporter [Pasteuria penetrans]
MSDRGVAWIRWGLWANLFLYIVFAATKCGVGFWAHAESILADGFNNTSDLFLSVAMLIGFRVAQRPADEHHSFGHRRAETIAALIAASFMAIAALQVVVSSLMNLGGNSDPPHAVALPVSAASLVLMTVLASVNTYLSRRTHSEILRVISHDNRSDALISAGTTFSLFITQTTNLTWVDPLVAIGVAVMVARTAVIVGAPAIDSLMDGFDQEKLHRIRQRVAGVDGILCVRELRARSHGKSVWIEVTVGVDPNLSVLEGHRLTEHVEESLLGYEMIEYVHVHVEPEW